MGVGDVRVSLTTPKRSLRSLWSELRSIGAVMSYETFLRWVYEVEDEAVKRGYLSVRRGKKQKRYIVKDPEGLIKLLYEIGFAF
jgi:hypothetical protein